ncbi:hypothetical protein CYLTODRAFT_494964 [Cylindrobasidium torrendii FP15055 ss-10]|uniref:Uncharacterized protein n=1 Tax=Cylindrobasidium torrendii FP15055 ss-10 TaxID=1314674 RepID=A0A0D7AU83_9AGAR|nr:hypothetical protein CYLTODRAFT_494964 [Cylindrobasidium torrendii FP15055 ss-10]
MAAMTSDGSEIHFDSDDSPSEDDVSEEGTNGHAYQPNKKKTKCTVCFLKAGAACHTKSSDVKEEKSSGSTSTFDAFYDGIKAKYQPPVSVTKPAVSVKKAYGEAMVGYRDKGKSLVKKIGSTLSKATSSKPKLPKSSVKYAVVCLDPRGLRLAAPGSTILEPNSPTKVRLAQKNAWAASGLIVSTPPQELGQQLLWAIRPEFTVAEVKKHLNAHFPQVNKVLDVLHPENINDHWLYGQQSHSTVGVYHAQDVDGKSFRNLVGKGTSPATVTVHLLLRKELPPSVYEKIHFLAGCLDKGQDISIHLDAYMRAHEEAMEDSSTETPSKKGKGKKKAGGRRYTSKAFLSDSDGDEDGEESHHESSSSLRSPTYLLTTRDSSESDYKKKLRGSDKRKADDMLGGQSHGEAIIIESDGSLDAGSTSGTRRTRQATSGTKGSAGTSPASRKKARISDSTSMSNDDARDASMASGSSTAARAISNNYTPAVYVPQVDNVWD